MQIVEQQSSDRFPRHQSAYEPIPIPPLDISPEEEAEIRREAQMLYEATIRGLADVAAGRKLPSEVVKTGCSIDLNPGYFETPHDPDELDVEEFFGVLMGLRDIEAGRTVPDEIVSAEFEEYNRRLLSTL
ncbi:hypothetical protein PAQ31011_01434 [Pandoraea aquatica]|uniref:Uncharacterized protein n=1 Tax=Pandoraea aquatica TaxID=2508290 RepID=A0A5E4TGR5_9BURK|nr:hypothetical protein [Pandoraea aquatica]VVD87246.1 hypothetical protein PAQ31011_01434 [Pandoraea aquatica]